MRLLAAQFPQSGFEDFQAGAAPGLVGEAVPISYGLWGSNYAYILCVCG